MIPPTSGTSTNGLLMSTLPVAPGNGRESVPMFFDAVPRCFEFHS